MKTLFGAIVAATMLTSAAQAVTYSPVAQGPNAANFVYGYNAGSGFTAFNFATDYKTMGCPIGGTSCYTGPASFLGIYFAPSNGNYQGADLRSDEITFHPGPNGEAIGLRFVAPTTSTYRFTGYFRAADAPAGDGVSLSLPNGVTTLGVRPDAKPFSFDLQLAGGQAAQFSLTNNGQYFADTTGFSLSVAGVPEPAQWALMIGGFGLVGGALRRRTARVAFA